MTITEIEGIIVVTASEGKVLTNADQSLHSEQLWLGVDDSPDNYFEYDIEALHAERQAIRDKINALEAQEGQ